jgi:hypothetical protein
MQWESGRTWRTLLQVVREGKAKTDHIARTSNAFALRILHGTEKKAAGIYFQRPSEFVAPHTGQSSQLFAEAHRRYAQFLATVARSGLARIQIPVLAMEINPIDLVRWSMAKISRKLMRCCVPGAYNFIWSRGRRIVTTSSLPLSGRGAIC